MVTVATIVVGDRVISPFSRTRLLVETIRPGMYHLIELICRDENEDKHLLSLDPAELIARIV